MVGRAAIGSPAIRSWYFPGMEPAAEKLVTEDEYVAMSTATDERLEYLGGQVFATGRGTPRHNLISANVIAALATRLRGGPCRALSSDQQVYIAATGLYTYADVTVLCGAAELHPRLADTIVNPAVLVEVLSPSTEAYDRGEKFEHYKRIATLHEYVLIAQDERHIDKLVRGAVEGSWVLTSYGAGESSDALPLPSLGCEVPLAEIYDGVEQFPVEARAKRIRRQRE